MSMHLDELDVLSSKKRSGDYLGEAGMPTQLKINTFSLLEKHSQQ